MTTKFSENNTNEHFTLPLTPLHTKQPNLPKIFYKTNSFYGILHTLFAYFLFCVSLIGISKAVFPYSICFYILSGIIGYRFTIIIHECCHKTFFSQPWLNNFIGWVSSGCIIVSFPLFTRLHWLHHLHFRTHKDPQGSDYNFILPNKKTVFLHLISPLFFVNFMQKAISFLTQYHADHIEKKPLNSTATNTVSFFSKYVPIFNIIIIQSLVFVLTTQFGKFFINYLLYMISLVSIGLFLSRVRGFLEHGNLKKDHDSLPIARTHQSNLIEAFILSPLNFNYHNEHHRWPQVPFFRLPFLHITKLKTHLKSYEYSTSFLRSLSLILSIDREDH